MDTLTLRSGLRDRRLLLAGVVAGVVLVVMLVLALTGGLGGGADGPDRTAQAAVAGPRLSRERSNFRRWIMETPPEQFLEPFVEQSLVQFWAAGPLHIF